MKSMIRLRFAFLLGHALRFCCVDRDRDIMFAIAICVFMILLLCKFEWVVLANDLEDGDG